MATTVVEISRKGRPFYIRDKTTDIFLIEAGAEITALLTAPKIKLKPGH